MLLSRKQTCCYSSRQSPLILKEERLSLEGDIVWFFSADLSQQQSHLAKNQRSAYSIPIPFLSGFCFSVRRSISLLVIQASNRSNGLGQPRIRTCVYASGGWIFVRLTCKCLALSLCYTISPPVTNLNCVHRIGEAVEKSRGNWPKPKGKERVCVCVGEGEPIFMKKLRCRNQLESLE